MDIHRTLEGEALIGFSTWFDNLAGTSKPSDGPSRLDFSWVCVFLWRKSDVAPVLNGMA
eukprot:CAMPEP_0194533404 /NCGR_PEP_ID=MMETSP0253-20130528/71287_1 /TAXON_ID=2966 /ORGANISM="Noctiluca scintillans" /LENGTH=58 /DNA_ID=CAMNT_0039378951 /DNA_START=167 /DNA_END=343 /DNA_ORIENTATION=+